MILGIPKRVLVIIAVVAGIGLVYVMGTDPASSSSGCRVTVTADVLNVRGAPVNTAEIVGKFNQNAVTDAEPVVENGFRKLGENKWAAAEFLQPIDATKCGAVTASG